MLIFLVAILFGTVFGLLAGGRIDHLANVRLRWIGVLVVGLVLRFGVGAAIDAGLPYVNQLRLPLYDLAFGLVLVGLWKNRAYPGLSLAFVGVSLNLLAITVNGGYMPVWIPSLLAAGFPANEPFSSFHVVLPQSADLYFVTHAGMFGDVIPIPIPFIRNVASIGDLFLASGLAFFVFATIVRTPTELDEEAEARVSGRLAALREAGAAARAAAGAAAFGGTDLAPGLAESAALERPLILGGAAPGLATPGRRVVVVYIPPLGPPPIVERIRRHPYVRLALDGSFSALWLGQLISLFGDRIHFVALVFLVLGTTNSAVALASVILAGTVPNLLFGPIAGALVDRWDQREVMIVSDLLRAGLVLLIPVAFSINLILVYPLVFLVTTVSIFFRPAKGAIVPRLVADEDLLPANSALWVGETFADIVGYALAGIFVAFLGSQVPLAFWIDAVTYVGSALLVATIVVAPLTRAAVGAVTDAAERAASTLWAQLKDGWRFLRGERVLLANTAQAVVAQFMLGTFIALTPIYARSVAEGAGLQQPEVFAFLEGSIGAGNLVGGFLVGLIGARLSLGRMVIVGYAVTGACVAALALTGNLAAAIGLAFGAGAGNLVFVIPSQTLFHRRTPPELMGRVLSFRSSLVFGSMTIAIAVGGVLGEAFGAAPVIGLFGLVTVAAGLAGLLVPAVRDA